VRVLYGASLTNRGSISTSFAMEIMAALQ
jgi:hypothetical protein